MTAETLTATKGKAAAVRPGVGPAGNLKVQYSTYNIAANVEDGDIFEMLWLPANSTVVGGFLYADPLDTHATPTLDMDIGIAANGVDSADPDAFGNLGVWDDAAVTGYRPEAGHIYPLGGKLITDGPQTYTVPTKIQIEANAAAATFAAGQVTLVVFYSVND